MSSTRKPKTATGIGAPESSKLTESRKALRAAGYDPIPVKGKAPGITGWQKFVGTTDKIIEGWEKRPDEKSTGLLTERMPTLDIDIKDDKAATAVETLLIERFRDSGSVMTRFGNAPKRAIVFRADKPFKKITANLIAPDGSPGEKLELLGKGQQVVAFGIHPDTGKPYQWIAGEPGKVARDELPAITEAEARKLVDDAADLLVRDHGYKRVRERPKSDGKTDSETASSDWGYLTGNILEGHELHDNTRDLAMKLVRSGMKGGAAVNFIRALMDKSDAKQDHRWLARRDDIKRLVADAEGKKTEPDATDKSELIYFNEAVSDETSKNWLIKNVVAKAETSSWIGAPKTGKSALIIDLCYALAAALAAWRGFTIKQACGVIYFALERGDLVKRRLRGHAKRDGGKDIPFALRKGILNLMDDACIDSIVATIEEAATRLGCDVGLIVIDTFSKGIAAGGGDENKAADQNKVAANLRQVQERTGVHVALVGHTGKDESRGARGSNAHLGDVDVMVQFTNEGEVVAVEVTGANDQTEGPLTRFKLEPIEIGKDEDGEIISTFIVDQEEHGKHKLEKEKRLPPQQQLALDILHRAMKAHGKKTKDGDHYLHLLSIDAWKAACMSEGLSAGDEKSFHRIFRKCVDTLREAKKIAIIDGNIRLFYHPGGPAPEAPKNPPRNGVPLNVYQLFAREVRQLKIGQTRINTADPHPSADQAV